MSSTALEIPGWYIEFQAALLRQAPRPGEIEQTTAEGWTSNQKELKKNLANCLLPSPAAEIKAEPVALDPLLESVHDSIIIPATVAEFIPRDRFIKDTSATAPVKISYLSGNFKVWFLKGEGKIEKLFPGSELCLGRLLRYSLNNPILKEIGGNEKAETSLTEIFFLMKKQPKGEKGILSIRKWNVFYVLDCNGVFCALRVHWGGDGWDVEADSVEGPDGWDAGDRVFSRNSFLKSSVPLAPAQA